jgi:heme/copper-type cytochrome/quinol oxidase subunit 3
MNITDQTPDQLLGESAEVHERNLRIGVRVMAGSTIMFFLAFVFAYFYLRALNTNGLWQPAGVDPPQAWGAVILALFVLSAGALTYALHAARQGRPWLVAVALALLLALAGCVAQGFEYAHLAFGPQSGGYASVFIGSTSLFVVFVLPVLYWVETLVAEGLRSRHDRDAKVSPGLQELTLYWQLLAAIGVIVWVMLYLI